MKTKLMILMVAIVVAVSSFAQMSNNDKLKIAELDKRISECNLALSNYEVQFASLADYSSKMEKIAAELDSLNSDSPKTKYGKVLKKQTIKDKETLFNDLIVQREQFKKLKQYELQKENLSKNYIVEKTVPDEISGCRKNRIINSVEAVRAERIETNSSRREDLTFQKLKKNPLIGDSLGLMGIIVNKFYLPISFEFTSLDGGENKSILVGPGKMVREKLITGNYLVTCFDGGRQIGKSREVSCNSVLNRYVDKINSRDVDISCHWYVFMPSL